MTFELSRLSNGLKVLTVPMKDRASAAVAIWVRAGARYEPAGISGVSHYLEHMLFKGTRSRTTRQIKQEIEGVGGLLNAFTGEECTCYFARLLKEHYPKALDVLTDMVRAASLPPSEMEKERTVIIEEIKMYRDLPAHYVHELIGELLWPEHALGRPISGTVETVSKLTRAKMFDYKKHYYHPRNLVLSVSGPIRHQDIRDWAARHFPGSAKYPPARFTAFAKRQTRSRSFFLEKPTEQTHFVVGVHGFSRSHPDRYKLALLNIILGGNMSSRLFEEVREKRGLAYEIKSGCSFFQDTGAFLVSAGVENKKTPLALSVILRELGKTARKPVSEGELRRAKDYFISQLFMAMEDTLDHLLWSGERALYTDQLETPGSIRDKVEAVTAVEIRDVAGRIFKTESLNFALIGPVESKIQQRIKRDLEIS